jgi:hypothetical protein
MWLWYGSAQAALAFAVFGVALLVVVGVALGFTGLRLRHTTTLLGRLSTADDRAARGRVPTRSAA